MSRLVRPLLFYSFFILLPLLSSSSSPSPSSSFAIHLPRLASRISDYRTNVTNKLTNRTGRDDASEIPAIVGQGTHTNTNDYIRHSDD